MLKQKALDEILEASKPKDTYRQRQLRSNHDKKFTEEGWLRLVRRPVVLAHRIITSLMKPENTTYADVAKVSYVKMVRNRRHNNLKYKFFCYI